MKLKEVVEGKIPDRIKKLTNYRLFLVWVSEADSKTIPQLKKELDGDIKFHQNWLDKNEKTSLLGTKNRFLTSTAKYIDFLKTIKKEFVKFL